MALGKAIGGKTGALIGGGLGGGIPGAIVASQLFGGNKTPAPTSAGYGS